MKLYYAETMNPRKVCALAKHLGSPVEYHRIELAAGEHKGPEHIARNPNGLVPVLVDQGRSIWESSAILVHLAFKSGSEMWPMRDPDKQVEVVRWLAWEAAHWAPAAGAFYFERIIKPMFGLGEPDTAALDKKVKPVQRLAKVLEQRLAINRFLAGNTMTIADFAVGVLFCQADQMGLPVADFRSVARWHDELMKLDAYRDPWPMLER